MKVIITGMHRSGTSMVAGLLKKCGLYLGENLISGLRDNPRGHFEDREFVAINDRILSQNGGSWSNPPTRTLIITPLLVNRIQKFLSKWPKDKIVGWKDPRACITLPIWKKALKAEALKVIIVRRPWPEIALSLEQRNGFSYEKSIELIKNYLERLEENVRGTAYINTFYHSYFTDWRSELEHLCFFLGLHLPDDVSQIESFIDSNLWHHRVTDEYSVIPII